jgi:hypothetical protein
MLAVALTLFTFIALGLAAWQGGKVERAAVLVLLGSSVATPLVQSLFIDDFRWGVAAVDVTAALGLGFLSTRVDRWWLIAVTGLQITVALTHFAALGPSFVFTWTAVTVRMVTWVMILIVLCLGACEAHVVRRYGLARA